MIFITAFKYGQDVMFFSGYQDITHFLFTYSNTFHIILMNDTHLFNQIVDFLYEMIIKNDKKSFYDIIKYYDENCPVYVGTI